ncbi:MAG: BON domain-containing protein [Planctomycetota bacterium]|nr:BON domain-containing protein [Planctomycetota bacterium]
MQQTTPQRLDSDQAPAFTPLCESYPPRFAVDAFDGTSALSPHAAHQKELDVRNELLAETGVVFGSLVVRRTRDGVCLQGYVEFDDQPHDLTGIARRIAGVAEVLNHLVVGRCVRGVPR